MTGHRFPQLKIYRGAIYVGAIHDPKDAVACASVLAGGTQEITIRDGHKRHTTVLGLCAPAASESECVDLVRDRLRQRTEAKRRGENPPRFVR